jgi:hypothetical protein
VIRREEDEPKQSWASSRDPSAEKLAEAILLQEGVYLCWYLVNPDNAHVRESDQVVKILSCTTLFEWSKASVCRSVKDSR